MAKTNANGYFCNVSCEMGQANCQIFFCAGCPASGSPLKPNTEYPQYKRYVNGTEEAHVPTSEELEDIFRQ